MDFAATELARVNLTEREWPKGDPQTVAGAWSRLEPGESPYADRIGDWATREGLDGVVWTKLPPWFQDEARTPSAREVVQYLGSLANRARRLAEEYVRRAPRQVATPYRESIEALLGWTYDGSLTDPNIRQ